MDVNSESYRFCRLRLTVRCRLVVQQYQRRLRTEPQTSVHHLGEEIPLRIPVFIVFTKIESDWHLCGMNQQMVVEESLKGRCPGAGLTGTSQTDEWSVAAAVIRSSVVFQG